MKTLTERVQHVMTTKSWEVGDVARIAGVSTSAVYQWLGGGSKPIHSIGNIQAATKLQDASGFSALWIAKGQGPMHKAPTQKTNTDSELTEEAGRARAYRQVPIVGTARMGDDGFYEEISSIAGAGDGHIEIATEDPNAYGLRVRGQSMFPAIRDGWYVLVEPNGTPRPGEYVLLKLHDGRKMVKELLNHRSDSVEVISVNGGARLTFDASELHEMQAVGAVVSPSKWRPD